MDFNKLLQEQKDFFASNTTKAIDFRKKQLKKLKSILQKNEQKLYEAIHQDFGKSAFETYSTELSFVYNEIDFFLKNISSLSKPKRVSTNLANQLGTSKIYSEPFGNILVIGAWNYPYQLSLLPAVCAIATGNTVLLKPSEIAEHSAKAMAEMINTNFDCNYFHVVLGGVEETTEILKLRFDKIFFTGSPKVGQIVYEAAAKHLTPVTLELGGKSPAIVTKSADIGVTAKRIVWGKFLNAGQTCIAPDYAFVDESIKPFFLEKLKSEIEKSGYIKGSENYTFIINDRNFQRLKKLIIPEKVFYGGENDQEKRFIQPTILENVNWEDAIMKEEIFGPILPVLTYKHFGAAIDCIKQHEKPLSAYLFSKNEEEKKRFVN